MPENEPGDGMTATSAPKNKVVAATGGAAIGSAIAVVITWILTSILEHFAVKIPVDVTTAISSIFTTLTAFLAGYYTPPGANEGVVTMPDGTVKSAVK